MDSKGFESLGKVLLNNNISAKKKFGQNFLHDKNIINQIVKASNSEGKNIVEVGPGPCLLTKILLEKNPKSVLAIETDKSFLPILNKIKEDYPLKFNFIIQDILKVDLDNLIKDNYSIVSNLPYNISVPFITSLIEKNQPVKWDSLTLTVQKEVADRMLAEVDSRQYGRLSVLTKWRSYIEKVCDIKPTCFIPEPKVMSTVIKIRPKNNITSPSVESFKKIASAAFGFRRKTLKKSLSQLGIDGEELAKRANINPKLSYDKVYHFLNLVGLNNFENFFPNQLSGGMKMRVAIARALITQPKVILMDEPFGALDEITRFKLNNDLLKIYEEYNLTVIFITHSVYESAYLSNRIAFISNKPAFVNEVINLPKSLDRKENYRLTSQYLNDCRFISEKFSKYNQLTFNE